MATTEASETRWLGRSVKRREDDRFIVGRGNYIDDIKLPGMLHMAIGLRKARDQEGGSQ